MINSNINDYEMRAKQMKRVTMYFAAIAFSEILFCLLLFILLGWIVHICGERWTLNMYFKVYSLLFNYIRIDCFACLFVCLFYSTFFLSPLSGHIYSLLSIYFRLICACALITFLMGSPHAISSSQRITNFSNISFAEELSTKPFCSMRVIDNTFLRGIIGAQKYDLSPCYPGSVGVDTKLGYAATTFVTQNLLGWD